MCRFDCCNSLGVSEACETGLPRARWIGSCPYCDMPVYDVDEFVRRGRGVVAHYECWQASGDGA